MPYQDLINQKKKDFDGIFEHAKNEIATIRTGRANSSLVEDVTLEYMGSKVSVKELGTISVPEPKMLLIQPWDKSVIPLIEKAVKDSTSSLSVSSDGQGVRVVFPSLTEDRRKELVKLLGQKTEEARIKSRHVREEIIKKVQAEVKAKTAREDDLHKTKDELQKIMDNFNKKLDEVQKKKEQELMTA